MSTLTVVYEACVLFPAPLRSLLMYLAVTDLYRARWSHDIHREWMKSVHEKYADITPEKLERIRELMDMHVRDCLVSGYEPLIETLSLPDPDDRHVLAAAIQSEASVIVTFNLKDFPAASLAPFDIEAQHPDDFLNTQLEFAPTIFCGAATIHRASLKKPPKTVEEYLASLDAQGLHKTVLSLRNFHEWL